MSWIGKIAGAFIGYLLFRNVFGALLGGMLGHFLDTGLLRPRAALGASFIEPLFAFAGALSKSDGRVSEQEIRAAENLMARLRLDDEQRRIAIDRFTVGKQADYDVQRAVAELRQWTRGRRDLAFLLLDMLLDLVYAEGPLAVAKEAMVRKLCWSLGVSDAELAAVAAMKGYGSPHGAWQQHDPRGSGAGGQRGAPSRVQVDPYTVLGIKRGAEPRDIKRAYRKLMSQHHPDKLGDVPDELKRRAEAQAREINAAYERIKSEQGFT
ncbi:MAG TPA: co-chaperone DjlA [Dokdonella sp.]|uniref:co-chaperone DjlA n=1 Tax=Dokdonella sp. TaxID=2291710 RepID=UPI0025BC1BE1|nr:co-chaperone DjlA [Dokdonella sp.]MBX3691093.1 co-chaperone DjlA [Dokdonella sp.]MCW5567127.1 co-chaperone DjlA [Dokdonella sp.]HNR92308.1 co-chaperone DjlA [Dokdonella sp.]